jgi:Tol biopolymer transport system component
MERMVLRPGFLSLLAAAIVAGLVAVAGTGDPAQAAYPGTNGVIAYSVPGTPEGYGTATVSLWAMNPDGSAQQALHQTYVGDPLEVGASWSPDGNTIAFTRCAAVLFGCDQSREIWLRASDGSNPRKVSTGTQPTWFPGGNALVITDYYFFPDGYRTSELYRLNIDGTGRTLLTTPDNCGKGLPKVSPLGDRVAFQWSCPYLDRVSGVYAIPAGGGEPQRLTPATVAYEGYGGFDWSPDGNRIVYSREANAPLGTQQYDLFVVDLATGVATRVTNTGYSGGQQINEQGPVFSPDGTKIAYHRGGNIWVMNADGSGQTPLTATDQREELAELAALRRGSDDQMRADGSAATATTSGPATSGPATTSTSGATASAAACTTTAGSAALALALAAAVPAACATPLRRPARNREDARCGADRNLQCELQGRTRGACVFGQEKRPRDRTITPPTNAPSRRRARKPPR